MVNRNNCAYQTKHIIEESAIIDWINGCSSEIVLGRTERSSCSSNFNYEKMTVLNAWMSQNTQLDFRYSGNHKGFAFCVLWVWMRSATKWNYLFGENGLVKPVLHTLCLYALWVLAYESPKPGSNMLVFRQCLCCLGSHMCSHAQCPDRTTQKVYSWKHGAMAWLFPEEKVVCPSKMKVGLLVWLWISEGIIYERA